MLDSKTTLYLNKEVFDYDLTMAEVRLLMVLSSNKGLSVKDLSKAEKLEIVSNSRNYKLIPTMIEKLVELNLLDENGVGKEIGKEFVIINGLEEVKNIKNLRQLFLFSVHRWYKNRKQTIITISRFENLFGDNKRDINKYWKRTNEQLDKDYAYKIEKNKVVIYNNVATVEEEVVEEVVEVKAKEETVEARTENYAVVEDQCSVEDLESFVNELTDNCNTTWSLVNGGVR